MRPQIEPVAALKVHGAIAPFMVRGCFVPEGKLVMPQLIADAH
jgi:hypothetical protein